MNMQFNFDGNETPGQLAAISAAINAYCDKMGINAGVTDGKFFMSAGVREACQPQPQVIGNTYEDNSGDRVLKKFAEQMASENPSHSFTCGMSAADIVAASKVFADAEPTVQCHPTEADAIKVFEEKEANILQQASELDAAGKLWDPGIHASSKTKTADGCWKFKRGIDPALQQAENANDTSAPPAPSVIVAQSEPIIPPPPPAPAATEAHTLPWLMEQCAKHKKTKADIDAALAACKLKTIPDLLGQLDKMDDVAGALGVL